MSELALSRSPLACLAFVLTQITCARPQAVRGAYLYEVTCEALVDKFDTRTERRVESSNLAARSGTPPLIPVVVGPVEVCLLNRVSFDATTSVFYAVVPARGKETVGPIGYSVLGFSVPAMSVVARSDAGMAEYPPRLEPRAGTPPLVVAAGAWREPSEPLGAFAPEHRDRPNSVLARSGHRALVAVATALGHPDLLGVADEERKTFAILQDPGTTREYVHLVPGGSYVLVEDTVVSGTQRIKAGALHLYDSTTGGVVKTIADDRIRSFYFHGVSPNGKVLYELADAYWFLDLGVTFGAEQVENVMIEDFPSVPMTFFSDK